MQLADLRFLVVDDHSFQRWAVQNILRVLGAKDILLAPDGAAAMELLRSLDRPVDIIITDLDMPGMDGMELMRRLAGERSTASMIVTSALDAAVFGTVQTMSSAYGVDVVATLAKPVSTRGLAMAIEKHAARVAARSRNPAVSAMELHCALREGELQPRFEPRVDIAARTIVAADVGIVWVHPSRDMAPIDAFLGMIKDAGLAPQLAWRVLRDSVAACARWQRAGVRAGVHVPIAYEVLRGPDFADRVGDCAATLDVKDVVLRLDAPPAGDGLGTMLENVSRLRMKGFGIAIPYGPRYCHRGQFAEAAASELTIDLAAVRMEGDHAALVAAVGDARAAGMTIGARNLSSRADWEVARSLGMATATGSCVGVALAAELFAREVGRRPAWKGFA